MNEYDTLNWCGARVKNDGNFAGKTFTSVSATWTVPRLDGNPPAGATWYVATWVGLDGGSLLQASRDLLQAGVYQTLDGGAACYAFCLWNIDATSKYVPIPQNFPVAPGDTVDVQVTVQFDQNGNPNGASIYFNNQTTNQRLPVIPILKPNNAVFRGDTIEWVVERAAITDRKHEKLADIKGQAMDFINAAGSTRDGSPVSPAEGEILDMEEDAPQGAPVDRICKATIANNRIHVHKIK